MQTEKEIIQQVMKYTGMKEREVEELLVSIDNRTRFLHAVEDIKHGGDYSQIKQLYSQQVIMMH